MRVEIEEKQVNWSESATWTPEKIFYPENLEELRQILKQAKTEKKKVKAVGAMHSFSKCLVAEGYQVNMKNISGVINFDSQNNTIEVGAGILLRDLYSLLDRHSLSLPSIPNTDSITLGGAVSNCTHGTNVHYGTISSFVKEMKLLNANGELLTLSTKESEENRKIFEAALSSFGSLGIIYSITLNLFPPYDVVCIKQTGSAKELKSRITNIAKKFDSAQFMFFPFSDLVLLKTQEKIALGSRKHFRSSKIDNLVVDTILWFFKPKQFSLLGQIFGKISKTKIFNTFCRNFYKSTSVGKWWTGEVSKDSNKFYTMEYAIDLSKIEFTLEKILSLVEKYKEKKKYVRHLPFILRPVGADKFGYLSPCYNRDTCYIDILFQSYDENEIDFYKEVESLIISLGGRVAWSRKFFAKSRDIKLNYPKYDEFYGVMKSVDPDKLFSNPFIEDIFEVNYYG